MFDVNSSARNDSEFNDQLNRELAAAVNRPLRDAIVVIDLSDGLSDDKYFRLDDHIMAAGHELIAQEVMMTMGF